LYRLSIVCLLSVYPSVCPPVTKLLWPTPQKLLVQFLLNFTGITSTSSSWTYSRHFSVQWFCQRLKLLSLYFSFLNHWSNFKETLHDWSVAQVLAHITQVLWPSYDIWIKMCFVLPDTQYHVRTTSQNLLIQFHPNIKAMISAKSSCAYHRLFLFNKFCQSFDSSSNAISLKFYRIDW
jgi:hypothetical protein